MATYNAELILPQFKNWLFFMARELTDDLSIHNDLAQEGYIAMWKALKTYDPAKGALPSWITMAARLRMKDVLRRDTWTGTIGVRGHVREKPAMAMDTNDPDMNIDQYLEASENLEWVLIRYHEGEILRALNELTPEQRNYVIRRFWYGQTNKDIKAVESYSPESAWVTSRKRLQDILGHLATV